LLKLRFDEVTAVGKKKRYATDCDTEKTTLSPLNIGPVLDWEKMTLPVNVWVFHLLIVRMPQWHSPTFFVAQHERNEISFVR